MENIKFKTPDELSEDKKQNRLLSEGGIYYEKIEGDENSPEKAIINILGVELETYASKEDIEAIKNEIILSNLDQTLLRKTAESYKLKQAILFEGDPGAGKTFLFEKFIEMLYGKDCPIDTLVGSPRTSELDILGHWAPRGNKEVNTEEYHNELKNYHNSEAFKNIEKSFNTEVSSLNEKLNNSSITSDQFEEEFSKLSTEFTHKQKDSIINHFSSSSLSIKEADWEFKEGALLRAYSGRNGRGYPLIVDEFNIIPSNYQQIFLQIGGQSGGLSDKVSFWGNGGKTSYHRGNETALFFASNFPEKTEGRSEVVAPMSDRLVWTVLSDKEYQEKKRAIKQTAGGRLKNKKSELFKIDPERVRVSVENGIQWDEVLDEKLGDKIADTVDILDDQFVKNYQSLGDKLSLNNETRKRTQKLEFSGRNALRLFSYLDKFQVRNSKTGEIDFTETLRRGYEMYYVSRLASQEMQDKAWKIFDQLLTGDTGKIEFDQGKTLAQKIKEVDMGKKVSKTITRKEVLDFYVEKLNTSKLNQEENKEILINKLEKGNIFEELKISSEYFNPEIYNNATAKDLAQKIKASLSEMFDETSPAVLVDTSEKYDKYKKDAHLSENEIRYLQLKGVKNISHYPLLDGDAKDSLLNYYKISIRDNSEFANKIQELLNPVNYIETQGNDFSSNQLISILRRFVSGDLNIRSNDRDTSNFFVFSDKESHDYWQSLAENASNVDDLKEKSFCY